MWEWIMSHVVPLYLRSRELFLILFRGNACVAITALVICPAITETLSHIDGRALHSVYYLFLVPCLDPKSQYHPRNGKRKTVPGTESKTATR